MYIYKDTMDLLNSANKCQGKELRGWCAIEDGHTTLTMNKQRQNIRGELCNSDPCPSKARGNRTCRALALEDVGSWG